MNGRANCILLVCCRAGSEAQKAALTAQIIEDTGLDRAAARTAAEWIARSFDLAPLGSLTEFKGHVARLAREPQDHSGELG